MQMLREDQLTGKTLGEYQIERLLGHGQLSAVYLAHHKTRGQAVMVTVFNYPDDGALRKQYSALFAREAAALVKLQHPHILPTCDYGEQDGQPYLVTTYVKGASLAQALKEQERLTVKQTLTVFKQLASGLDEAHSKGVTHGILSLSNVLMGSDLVVQIAGFGLKSILEMQANTQSGQPQAHLFSANGIFLGNPAYISPERVMGMQIDARSDIYALGIMLFEMLSGKLPFQGSTSLETALMRIQRPVPSLHEMAPSIPEAFDLIINKALERDPARRYQHAGEIAASFERVTRILDAAGQKGAVSRQQPAQQDSQITLPPTINWFDEDRLSTGKWQLMPPIITGHHPAAAIPPNSNRTTSEAEISKTPHTGALADQPTTTTSAKIPTISQTNRREDSLAGMDPFAWWTGHTARNQSPTPGTFAQHPPVRLAKKGARRQPGLQERRRAVKLIATGGAVVGVLAVGGISFAHFAQSLKNSQSLTTTAPGTATHGTTATAPGNTPTSAPTHGISPQKTATPSTSPTKSAQPSPTARPTQQPTQQPTPKPTQSPPIPTPTPPAHTGTVIGNTNMPSNSSLTFNNPADGQNSLLIRLANGNFVACERACTHAGVPVDYNSGQQQIVCPAHGAIFDPTNGFAHTSGPGNGPLASVSIRVNADGTITTG
ncbi:MAG TPA: protein kinase [Ktedonobacteraceae bacterium]